MRYVDSVLDEFQGQLSIHDIYGMTKKELDYLRKHRQRRNIERNKAITNSVEKSASTRR